MLVERLKGENLFEQVPGRHHRSFPTIAFESGLKGDKLNTVNRRGGICNCSEKKILQCINSSKLVLTVIKIDFVYINNEVMHFRK